MLITGGEQFLPFAQSCVRKLKRLGLPYANQSYEIDGVSIKVRIEPGHEYIRIEGQGGFEYIAYPNSDENIEGKYSPSTATLRVSKGAGKDVSKAVKVKQHVRKYTRQVDWRGEYGTLYYDHKLTSRYGENGFEIPISAESLIVYSDCLIDVSPHKVVGVAILSATTEEREREKLTGKFIVFATIDAHPGQLDATTTLDLSPSNFTKARFYRFPLPKISKDVAWFTPEDIPLIAEVEVEGLFFLKPWFFSRYGRSAVTIASNDSTLATKYDSGELLYPHGLGYHPSMIRAASIRRNLVTAEISLTSVQLTDHGRVGDGTQTANNSDHSINVLLAADYDFSDKLSVAMFKSVRSGFGRIEKSIYIDSKLAAKAGDEGGSGGFTDAYMHQWTKEVVYIVNGGSIPTGEVDEWGNPINNWFFVGTTQANSSQWFSDLSQVSHLDLRDKSLSFNIFTWRYDSSSLGHLNDYPDGNGIWVTTISSTQDGKARVSAKLVIDGKLMEDFVMRDERFTIGSGSPNYPLFKLGSILRETNYPLDNALARFWVNEADNIYELAAASGLPFVRFGNRPGPVYASVRPNEYIFSLPAAQYLTRFFHPDLDLSGLIMVNDAIVVVKTVDGVRFGISGLFDVGSERGFCINPVFATGYKFIRKEG